MLSPFKTTITMSVSTSKQMFINMNPKDIPYYDQRKPFWEQSNDTIQFFLAELDKITNGITIGGYKMHGWEYFHLNYFVTPIPQKTGNDIDMRPPLDDNTFYIMECYKQAEREGLGLFLWGTRGFAKSTYIASLKQWTVLTKGGTSMLIGKERGDLDAIQKLINKSMGKIHPAFKVDTIRADWEADVDYGIKYKNDEDLVLSTIAVRNAEAGKSKASEKGAGLTPTGFVMDEALAFDSILYSREKELTMEEVTVGDKIYGDDGKLTTVIDKIDVGVVPMYEFTLSDGRKVESSADHVWTVYDHKLDTVREVRTEEIAEKEFIENNSQTEREITRYSLPKTKPVEYPEKETNLDMYLLGIIVNHLNIEEIKPFLKGSVKQRKDLFEGMTHGEVWRYRKYDSIYKELFYSLGIDVGNKYTPISTVTKKEPKQAYCIKVDNESNLFLTNGYIVTHNCGKYSPKEILLAAMPSLYSEYGARCTYILAGTGGNSVLSEGAKEILMNPKDFKLSIMNWDLLNNMVPEEHITWKEDIGKQFSMFVPGQFSYRNEIERKSKKFSNFLRECKFTGKLENKSELDEMNIRTVNWEYASSELKRRVDEMTTDSAKIKQRMYLPLTIADSFLEDKSNIFDIERAKQKQLEIKKNPKYQAVTLARDETSGKFLRNFSDAPIAGREHTGKPINSPILIYGTFPETIPQIHRHVSSLDDYKQDKAETKSLGAFYVLERRMLDIDKPFETIKLSYASRPERHTDFWKNCEKGISAFNALCCMESADVGFVSYLEDTLKVNAYDYLTPAFSPGNEKVSKNRQTNSRFGIYPTSHNKQYLINLVLEYTNEQQIVGYDDTGKPIIKTGMDYIEDYWLLQEMIDYNPDANVDRIVAFGHALAWARRLDREGIRPKDDFTEKFKDQNNRNRAKIKMQNFSKVRYKNF